MADITNEDLIKHIEEMPVLQLNELVKAIEEKFGVSAAMAAPVAVAAAGPAGDAGAAEEKTEFDVILSAIGPKKINVIKVVREVTSLGLKEAKALVDGVASGPQPVKEDLPKDEAEKIKGELEAAGAIVGIE